MDDERPGDERARKEPLGHLSKRGPVNPGVVISGGGCLSSVFFLPAASLLFLTGIATGRDIPVPKEPLYDAIRGTHSRGKERL